MDTTTTTPDSTVDPLNIVSEDDELLYLVNDAQTVKVIEFWRGHQRCQAEFFDGRAGAWVFLGHFDNRHDAYEAGIEAAELADADKIELKLPRIFHEDHKDRDLASGAVVKTTKLQVEIVADHDTVAEIWSDAHFYATCEFDPGSARISGSAKSTLKALLRQVDEIEAAGWDELADRIKAGRT